MRQNVGFGCPTNFLEPRFTLDFTTDQRSEIGPELANNAGSSFTEHRIVEYNPFVLEYEYLSWEPCSVGAS